MGFGRRSSLFISALCAIFFSACAHKMDYRGDFGQGLLPADSSSAPYVSLAAFESPPRLYARVTRYDEDPRWRGQVLAFSLPEGDYLGTLEDADGSELRALRVFATSDGMLGAAKAVPGAYEIAIRSHEGRALRELRIPFAAKGDSEASPFAVGFAAAEGGDLAVAWADRKDGGPSGVVLYRGALASGGASEVTAAAAADRLELGDLRKRLPVSVAGPMKAQSIQYLSGRYFIPIEMESDPFDGVLVLDRDLGFVSYLTAEWAFNCPVSAAPGADGALYVSNRWAENLVAYRGKTFLAATAKDGMAGSEGGLMDDPGAVAVAGGEVYVYDSANGRIRRFAAVARGSSRDDREAYPLAIIPRYAAEGSLPAWLSAFLLGILAMMSLHGFIVGARSREGTYLAFGLMNLTGLLFFIERSYNKFFIDLSEADSAPAMPWIFLFAVLLFIREFAFKEAEGGARGRRAIRALMVGLALFFLVDRIALLPILALRSRAFRYAFECAEIGYLAAIVWVLIAAALRGNRAAAQALALNGAFIVAGALSMGVVGGSLIEGGPFSQAFREGYPLIIGYALSSLFFSLNLGDRFGEEKAARRLALREAELLRETDRQRSDFVMNVSHELRTPLAVILGLTERLSSGRCGDSIKANEESLRSIARNAKKLLKNIGNLFDLGKIEQGAASLSPRPILLHPFLRRIAGEFDSLAESRGISLACSVSDPELCVLADPELLETAILNLLSNALKFTPEGGSVSLGARLDAQGKEARIEVRDTGVGMSGEEKAQVFRRFYRGGSSSNRKYEGAGIGLTLAREAVRLHGGRLEVESETGRGSAFAIVLPFEHGAWESRDGELGDPDARKAERFRAEFEKGGAAPPPPEGPASGAAARSVLVVEDNADLRGYLVATLSDSFRVRAAANGREALELLEEETPDCVVSDIMMPEMDGRELFAAMRRDGRWSELPFVFLSALADADERILSLEGGALDFIEKPFSAAELVAKVSSLAEWKGAIESGIKSRLKDSIIGLIDGFDSRGPRPVPPRDAAMRLEALFRDKGLSRREIEVSRLILEGLSDKEIAQALGLSPSTVGNHNSRIFRKLGVGSRMGLIALRR
jgi:signal transduction histidine kinase/DNA-binding NarL/FixJ family response regulator